MKILFQTDIPLIYVVVFLGVWYLISLAAYRLFLSPIASIPGPKLAALTQWYEIYWEMFRSQQGQFLFHYRELHEKYGPIIRLNPHEVHIQDSQFYHVFFSQSRSWDKPDYQAPRFNNPNGVFATPNHETHRKRRAALNPFFSKQKISAFAPSIQPIADRVCKRLSQEYKDTDKVLRLDWMLASYAADVVVKYCFEKQYDWVDAPDFFCEFTESMNSLLETTHLVILFPWIAKVLKSLPETLMEKANPDLKIVNDWCKSMRRQVDNTLKRHQLGKTSEQETVFEALLNSDLPKQELSGQRLQDEATTIIGAGIETTRYALSIACFHILNTPTILQKLQAELQHAVPDPHQMPSLETLERLPYLEACIQESLRLSYGISARNARVSDHITLQYGSFSIPPGTVISMENYSVSHDPAIFPDSHSYIPERWLNNAVAPDGKRLNHYLVSFGRGQRSCIGMPLAWAEMFIIMANLFRKFEFELYETDRTAIDIARDLFVARPLPGTKGVRVLVK